jgi:hypothetical protein
MCSGISGEGIFLFNLPHVEVPAFSAKFTSEIPKNCRLFLIINDTSALILVMPYQIAAWIGHIDKFLYALYYDI